MSRDKNTVRKTRIRYKLVQVANGKPRLSIHRTPRHIYAQIIDAEGNTTLAAASTVQEEVAKGLKSTGNVEAAKKAGVDKVVFDRGRYIYHGRVKALAEAARAAGLKF